MASSTETPPKEMEQHEYEYEEEEEEEKTFEGLGLDPRLIRALTKKGIEKPTPIQRTAIPFILEGKDVVARAKTGSGKTFAYLLPLLHNLLSDSVPRDSVAPTALVLVPTRELCQQIHSEVSSLIALCRVQLKVVQLSNSMHAADLRAALAGSPDILVSTPACIPKCFSAGVLQTASLNNALKFLILDEADLLLSYGYEDDLKALTALVSKSCQCLLMSATSSADVDKLKKLILHNAIILTLPEDDDVKDKKVPQNVQQFWISCGAREKLVHILALLHLELVQKKVLIFTNTINMSYRLKLFLEKFGIKSAVLNAELPQNSRQHILEAFNAGLFDYLIATDDCQTKEKEQVNEQSHVEPKKSGKHARSKVDSEYGVVRGIDFKNVHTVINFEMPQSPNAYVHRVGRTGRAYNSGASVSLVSPEEKEIFEEIKSFIGDSEKRDANFIAPFPLLTENQVNSIRYRAEDQAKSVTKIAVKEARAQDLRKEILNSEKLKSHFQANPGDLDLLKHDKALSKTQAPSHLRKIPDYLMDPTTKAAKESLKMARAAMGNNNSARRQGARKRNRKSKDPLKSLSAEAPKKSSSGVKRKGNDNGDGHKQKKKQAI